VYFWRCILVSVARPTALVSSYPGCTTQRWRPGSSSDKNLGCATGVAPALPTGRLTADTLWAMTPSLGCDARLGGRGRHGRHGRRGTQAAWMRKDAEYEQMNGEEQMNQIASSSLSRQVVQMGSPRSSSVPAAVPSRLRRQPVPSSPPTPTYRYLPLPTATYRYLPLPTATTWVPGYLLTPLSWSHH
jgi:hypothetical protein